MVLLLLYLVVDLSSYILYLLIRIFSCYLGKSFLLVWLDSVSIFFVSPFFCPYLMIHLFKFIFRLICCFVFVFSSQHISMCFSFLFFSVFFFTGSSCLISNLGFVFLFDFLKRTPILLQVNFALAYKSSFSSVMLLFVCLFLCLMA